MNCLLMYNKQFNETGIRHKASSIPIFDIDYITGDETFDIADPYTMVGTYWYDPVLFMKTINT
jgi:hypothetical protein